MSIQNWIRDFGLTEGHASGLDKTSRGRIQVLTSNFNGNFYVNFEDHDSAKWFAKEMERCYNWAICVESRLLDGF